MREYKTQMEAARRGIITPEMKKVQQKSTAQRKKSESLLQKARWLSAPTGFTPVLSQME